jgi:transcriptional regulator with XRE-family HTH domain
MSCEDGVGFEPTGPIAEPSGFRDRRLNPLVPTVQVLQFSLLSAQNYAVPARTPRSQAPRKRQPVLNRLLASELRILRQKNRLKGDRVAELMGWSPSKISRVERGLSPLNALELPALLKIYKASDKEIARFMAMAESSTAGAYHSAVAAMHWSPFLFPGALALDGYARRVANLEGDLLRIPPDERAEIVNRRTQWQTVTRSRPGFTTEVVLGPDVLERECSPMADQVAHAIGLSLLSNVTVQLLPPTTDVRLLAIPAFTYVQFSDVGGMSAADLVLQDQLQGEVSIDTGRETYLHLVAFRALQEAAMSPEKTKQAMERAQKKWPPYQAA